MTHTADPCNKVPLASRPTEIGSKLSGAAELPTQDSSASGTTVRCYRTVVLATSRRQVEDDLKVPD